MRRSKKDIRFLLLLIAISSALSFAKGTCLIRALPSRDTLLLETGPRMRPVPLLILRIVVEAIEHHVSDQITFFALHLGG
jgi:hypothetical protein